METKKYLTFLRIFSNKKFMQTPFERFFRNLQHYALKRLFENFPKIS
jgi:hypothetical protein